MIPELLDPQPGPVHEQPQRPLRHRPRLSPLPQVGSQHRQGHGVPHVQEDHARRLGEQPLRDYRDTNGLHLSWNVSQSPAALLLHLRLANTPR